MTENNNMPDLVRTLRGWMVTSSDHPVICDIAADAIEQLLRENARLREAVIPQSLNGAQS